MISNFSAFVRKRTLRTEVRSVCSDRKKWIYFNIIVKNLHARDVFQERSLRVRFCHKNIVHRESFGTLSSRLLLRRKWWDIDPIIYGWLGKVFMEVQQSFC